MRYLSGDEEKIARERLKEAADTAAKATCQRSQCGCVIVADESVIGVGYNSPPGDLESQRRCHRKDELKPGFKSDRTCCIHAEARAVADALAHDPNKLVGARLYFLRLDDEGKMKRSGQPYCTMCSKLALDVGIAEFVLWHEEGICVYDTQEYNDRSYAYPPDNTRTA